MNSALKALPRLTFGQLLTREREERGFSHRDVADRCGVDKSVVRAWESDSYTPDRHQLKKLFGHFRALRHYTHLLPQFLENAAKEDMRAAGEAPVEQTPAIAKTEVTPKTFGEALRKLRLHEGLHQTEVADLCAVHPNAVTQWESDSTIPVEDNYAKLITIFPELQGFPKPRVRDIDKPKGNTVRIVLAEDHMRNGTTDSAGAGLVAQDYQPHQPEPKEEIMPTPAPQPAPNSMDVKRAMMAWSRAVVHIRTAPNFDVIRSLLTTGRDAGMTIEEVLVALGDS